MSYRRVIPRDLFNEASLLKCVGKLWILLENRPNIHWLQPRMPAPFQVVQDPSDGSIHIANVILWIKGQPYPLHRPLNSRDPWPLYVSHNGADLFVFTNEGELTPEFKSLIS